MSEQIDLRDFSKLVALSDEDFKKFYTGLMADYGRENRLWQGENVPRCVKCKSSIHSPRELRRFSDKDYHPECFEEVYKRDNHFIFPVDEKNYWDRVAKLR